MQIRPSLLLILFACLFFQGCANYLVPLCNDDNRSDVPNLEGKFSTIFSMVTKDGSQVQRREMNISRLSRGVYFLEGRDETTRASVCEVEGHFYAEDNSGWHTIPTKNYMALQLSPNGDGSFDFVVLGMDSRVLDAQHIPYTISELPLLNQPPGQGTLYNLLVDNSKLTPEQFVQLLDPMSMKFTLRPETGGLF